MNYKMAGNDNIEQAFESYSELVYYADCEIEREVKEEGIKNCIYGFESYIFNKYKTIFEFDEEANEAVVVKVALAEKVIGVLESPNLASELMVMVPALLVVPPR